MRSAIRLGAAFAFLATACTGVGSGDVGSVGTSAVAEAPALHSHPFREDGGQVAV